MLDTIFRKAGKWWPATCLVFIIAGGLGLLFLQIDWPLVTQCLEAIQRSFQFLGQALQLLSYDLAFTVSALVLLIGTVALGFYVFWRFRRPVDLKEESKPREESVVGRVVRIGWPLLALIVAFIIAVARGESHQFVQGAAKQGMALFWIFLIVVAVGAGVIVWFWWSLRSSGGDFRSLFSSTGGVRRLSRKLALLLKHFGLASTDGISDRVKDYVCQGRDQRAINVHRAETGVGEKQAQEAITSWVKTGLEQKVDLVLKHLEDSARALPAPQNKEG